MQRTTIASTTLTTRRIRCAMCKTQHRRCIMQRATEHVAQIMQLQYMAWIVDATSAVGRRVMKATRRRTAASTAAKCCARCRFSLCCVRCALAQLLWECERCTGLAHSCAGTRPHFCPCSCCRGAARSWRRAAVIGGISHRRSCACDWQVCAAAHGRMRATKGHTISLYDVAALPMSNEHRHTRAHTHTRALAHTHARARAHTRARTHTLGHAACAFGGHSLAVRQANPGRWQSTKARPRCRPAWPTPGFACACHADSRAGLPSPMC